jgi:two-component system cell cycle response regulator
MPPFDDDDSEKTNVSQMGDVVRDLMSRSQRDKAYLIVLQGSNVGEMYRLEGGESVIGRGTAATIRLGDDGISRRHAKVVVQDKIVKIEDLGSANGTLVNGALIQQSALKDGDKIQLGSTTILKFTYHDYLDEVFQRQMYESALRDGLTKVFNKKYFTDYLEKEFAYAARHSSPLALIFLDIDYFKRINDTHGHPAGDFVLSELSQLMATLVRTEDVLARFGGEEFTVLCRGTDLGGARIVAERLRKTVEAHTFAFGAKTIPVTISLGIAAIPDTAIADHSAFLAASDKALYEAKRTGRNRVCLHGTEQTPKPAKRGTGSGSSVV